MSVIKAEFSEEFYNSLTNEQRSEISVRSVESGDYKDDPEWVTLKDLASKAYRMKIKREFKLREHLNNK